MRRIDIRTRARSNPEGGTRHRRHRARAFGAAAALRRRSVGFTLAELLTVIGIVAIIGTLGTGAFHVARRSYALNATAGELQAVLRAARNSALHAGSPAFVVVDPVERSARAYVYDPVGEWSFDETPNSFSVRREKEVRTSAVSGKVGRGRSFAGGGHIDCGNLPQFQLRDSILIEAWIRHREFRTIPPDRRVKDRRRRLERRRTPARAAPDASFAIVEKAGAYSLALSKKGRLRGSIGNYTVETTDAVVPPGRWIFVSLRYDGEEIDLRSEGVPRRTRPFAGAAGLTGLGSIAGARSEASSSTQPARASAKSKVPSFAPVTSAPLTISSATSPFNGEIDEVRVAGSVEPVEFTWSDGELILGWKKVIRFDRRGHLDGRSHDGEVRLVLVELPDFASRGTSTSVVDFGGTFDDWRARWKEPPPDLTEENEERKLLAVYASARKIAISIGRLGTIRWEELEP